MQDSKNKFQNLSIEVLLEIFDYLSITDCFNAFSNLHWTTTSALNLSNLTIDLTSTSRRTYEKFYQEIILTNHHRHQIRKFKLSNDLSIDLLEDFFDNYNLRDFKQLRSLTLIKPSYMTLSSLALTIPHLRNLEHISVDSNSYPENFFELVSTSSPSIKACHLPGFEIQEEFSFSSNIESLTITVDNIAILLNLLGIFKQLKYLNVIVRSTLYSDNDCSVKLNLVSCENLRNFKVQILERSAIDFKEMEYFFQHVVFHHLNFFSYTCTTNFLNHIDMTRWNAILSTHFSGISQLHFFVQIPFNSCSYTDLKAMLHDSRADLRHSFPLSLSMNYSYYIIHTEIYPKTHFDLSSKLPPPDPCIEYDPISCDTMTKFSKVKSLVVDRSVISPCAMLPRNIQHLHLQGENKDLTLKSCLKDCSKQLISLKIIGLPNDLPQLPNLRQLTVQQMMFSFNMVSKLAFLCPRLELLTMEIDCIAQFGQILDELRTNSNLTELKFLRVFSRDTNQTWSSWLNETKQRMTMDDAKYEERNLFLFIWL